MPPDPDLDHEILIQYLVESIRCNECGGLYSERDVHIIAQDDHAWTLLVVCSNCGADSMIMAYLDEDDSECAPPDLAEVRAWHQFLDIFTGDLRDLLRY